MERSEKRYPRFHSREKSDRVIKPKEKIPINLIKKARREQRNRNEQNERRKKTKKSMFDFTNSEQAALVRATEAELKQILVELDAISVINFNCTPEELLGEIAIAEGHATIIYVERDGLSTLTIVLPQIDPTIANLKRAIESTARVQLQREQRQRYVERLQRRTRALTTLQTTVSENSSSEHEVPAAKATDPSQHRQKQQQQKPAETLEQLASSIPSTGELVCSTARNGHHHRSNVSWRFLWRAYVLFHIERNEPIDDSNGRRLLSECGIENATTLKFCKREKYFGRKRQK